MNKNRISYMLICLFSIALLGATYRNSDIKTKRFVYPLFLTYAGINYIFDFFVLVLAKGYRYKPKYLKKTYLDNLLGANMSQLLIVPTSGVFLSIFRLNFIWGLLSSTLFFFIEKLFLKLNVYKHGWWSEYYTLIGLNIFYFVAKRWSEQLIDKNNSWIQYITVYLSIFVSTATLGYYLQLVLFKTYLFKQNWFLNPYRSHMTTLFIYTNIMSVIFTFTVVFKKLYLKSMSVVFLYLFELWLNRKEKMVISNPLFHLFSLFIKIISIAVGGYVFRSINRDLGTGPVLTQSTDWDGKKTCLSVSK
ncbi:hypothetical protein [Evansella tamaricis]|uniref:Uncharacterized protein n=1 Tax=Evansella tamaricis TaxID=2069301 RepID=A0ABS6JE11_9BACI|nr:hypothetical protein [Evansella tamaricis]MBU9711645.1 hypothetical protein [Evansella tamaricis]